MEQSYRHYLIEGERAGERYALAAPRNLPLGVSGSHLGNRAGSSLEFRDHREYQPGDDLRRIDWGAFARSDKLTIKLYREEISPHLDLLIDGSRSMALSDTAKIPATLGLAAIFATAAANSGYAHTTWMVHDGCEKISAGSERPSLWENIDFHARTDFAAAFMRVPPRWRPRGIRVLLSDLLWMGDPRKILSQFSMGASTVIVVQILAKADIEPPERGNIMLVDSETDIVQEIFLDAASEQRYREALTRHQQNWLRAVTQTGAIMTTVIAEEIVDNWHLPELIANEILRIP